MSSSDFFLICSNIFIAASLSGARNIVLCLAMGFGHLLIALFLMLSK